MKITPKQEAASKEAFREYLRRNKASSPESKLEWLAAAVEFARVPKRKMEPKAHE